MEPENDKSAAAAAPGAETPAEAPKGVSEADVQALLTSRFRAFEEKIGKTLSESLGALTGKLKEEITSALPKAESPATPEDKKRKDAPESPELKRLQEQIASLTKQAEDARSEHATRRFVRSSPTRSRALALTACARRTRSAFSSTRRSGCGGLRTARRSSFAVPIAKTTSRSV
jgi:hypothetical protein